MSSRGIAADLSTAEGGLTTLACKKPDPVSPDETAQLFDVLSISAGMRGLPVFNAPADDIRVVNARFVPIARQKK